MINKTFKTTLFFSLLIYNFSIIANANNKITVADELNALYNNTDGCVNGESDFYCSGIILHAETFTSDEPWYLPSDRDVGSFSYIRHDIVSHIGQPIWNVSQNTGYILAPQEEILRYNQYPYQVYCSYPMNGSTNGRLTHGCGDFPSHKMLPNTDYSTCTSKGIYTASQYMDKYSSEETRGGIPIVAVDLKACSFSPNISEFKISMELSKYLQRDITKKTCLEYAFTGNGDKCWTNNELIISTWPKEKVNVSQVPIKAFYVLINGRNSYPNPDLRRVFARSL